MRIAICDDSEVVRQEIEQMLQQYQNENKKEVIYQSFVSLLV